MMDDLYEGILEEFSGFSQCREWHQGVSIIKTAFPKEKPFRGVRIFRPKTAEQRRRRVASTMKWLAKNRERVNKQRRDRYRSDPEYRAKKIAKAIERQRLRLASPEELERRRVYNRAYVKAWRKANPERAREIDKRNIEKARIRRQEKRRLAAM